MKINRLGNSRLTQSIVLLVWAGVFALASSLCVWTMAAAGMYFETPYFTIGFGEGAEARAEEAAPPDGAPGAILPELPDKSFVLGSADEEADGTDKGKSQPDSAEADPSGPAAAESESGESDGDGLLDVDVDLGDGGVGVDIDVGGGGDEGGGGGGDDGGLVDDLLDEVEDTVDDVVDEGEDLVEDVVDKTEDLLDDVICVLFCD